ncbi:DNA repair protein rad16 [Phlyctema vagabunda]|uniref:DNA repair protein rad16 n=1 Tax=Phlyctema vagabunda TaxID=108571 RepID=A0ABR4PNK5_9HELO
MPPRKMFLSWEELERYPYDLNISGDETIVPDRFQLPEVPLDRVSNDVLEDQLEIIRSFSSWRPSGWYAPLKPDSDEAAAAEVTGSSDDRADENDDNAHDPIEIPMQKRQKMSESHIQEDDDDLDDVMQDRPQSTVAMKKPALGTSHGSFGETSHGSTVRRQEVADKPKPATLERRKLPRKGHESATITGIDLKKLYKIALEGAFRPDPTQKSDNYLIPDSSQREKQMMSRLRAARGSHFDLKPHQREGVGRAMNLEMSRFRGGVLGDDMGLGKTLQAICLMLMRPLKLPNLVVVPKSLVANWVAEIKKFVNPPPKIYVHTSDSGDPNRMTDARFAQYDIVITTYSKLVLEYKEMEEVIINFTMRRKYPKLRTRLVKDSKGKTKKVNIHHRRTNFPIIAMTWGRVFLDEAHKIRCKKTTTHKAAVEIDAMYRWAITGTPFANDYGDIHSLFCFLKVQPLNDPSFFHSYFTRVRKNENNQREETPALHGIRGGTLHLALTAVLIRRNKRAEFDGQGISSIIPPEHKDIPVKLDNTNLIVDVTIAEKDWQETALKIKWETMQRVRRFYEFHESGGRSKEHVSLIFEKEDPLEDF